MCSVALIASQVRELFEMYDTDADNSLSLNEVVRLLEDIGNKITSLPAVFFTVYIPR